MTDKTQKTARGIAVTVLDRFKPATHNAASLLNSMIEQTDQKAHATDLVFGTVRNMRLIDMILSNVAKNPPERINKKLLNIIRVGVYEFVFAPATAEYAIINEAVNLVSDAAGKRQAGFVNAVLRNIQRSIASRTVYMDTSDVTKVIPQSPTQGCLFKNPLLPDPQKDPAGYYSDAFSIPFWLIESWLQHFGADQTRKICLGSNRRPSVYLQPNTLKISAKQLAEKLTAEEIECTVFPDENAIRLDSNEPISKLPGFKEGLFLIQDPTAAKVAKLIAPEPGQTVADICAAPGGKTVGLAMQMENKGLIIATDIHAQRLKMVNQNCTRLGITIVNTIPYDNLEQTILSAGSLDAILLDVPCSNSGVMARRPEVRLRINQTFINELVKTQTEILNNAAKHISTGGKICYSTCSICPDENSELVKNFLENNPDFQLVCEELTLPTTQEFTAQTDISQIDHDGGYAAILLRK